MPDVKGNPYRFTLLFNQTDPRHRRTVEILNQQGKSKSQYIVTALEKRKREPQILPSKERIWMLQCPQNVNAKRFGCQDSRQPLGFYTKGKPPSFEGGG